MHIVPIYTREGHIFLVYSPNMDRSLMISLEYNFCLCTKRTLQKFSKRAGGAFWGHEGCVLGTVVFNFNIQPKDHPTLYFTPWSLDLFICVPFQLHGEHTVLQPFRRIELIVHIAFFVQTRWGLLIFT